MSVHVEALTHLQRAVAHLRTRGVSPGVALNPSTPIAALSEILPELDFVLVMSVNPGFSFQKLLPQALDKLRRLQGEVRARGLRVRLQVDGGVNAGQHQERGRGRRRDRGGRARPRSAAGDPEQAVRGLIGAAS